MQRAGIPKHFNYAPNTKRPPADGLIMNWSRQLTRVFFITQQRCSTGCLIKSNNAIAASIIPVHKRTAGVCAPPPDDNKTSNEFRRATNDNNRAPSHRRRRRQNKAAPRPVAICSNFTQITPWMNLAAIDINRTSPDNDRSQLNKPRRGRVTASLARPPAPEISHAGGERGNTTPGT